MMEVFRQSTAHGWRHYFYGSTQEVQEKMITRLQQEYPGLIIAGTDVPPFRELTPEEDALAVARINQARRILCGSAGSAEAGALDGGAPRACAWADDWRRRGL